MTTPLELRLPTEQCRVEEVEEVGTKLDALIGYFDDNAGWLDDETQERLGQFTDEYTYSFRRADVRAPVDAEEAQRRF